jgi:hypothetical protein
MDWETKLPKAIAHPNQRHTLVNSPRFFLRFEHLEVESLEDPKRFVATAGPQKINAG